jgi:glycine/D-amino acid oxidase-like deaminating enzyme
MSQRVVMDHKKAEVVICGAGIAGISAAYFLTVRHGLKDVLIIDERPPLTLTSDKSTEAYRNWWPGPDDAMITLMNRSIDLLEELAEESNNLFHLNRRGYVYATANRNRIDEFLTRSQNAVESGAGPLRMHRGVCDDPLYNPSDPESYSHQPSGCDLLFDRDIIRTHFPYLTDRTLAILHARRCGWFSGQQLGMYLLEQALNGGARLMRARVENVTLHKERVERIHVRENGSQRRITTRAFVNAAGPMLQQVSRMISIELPIFHERHLKVSLKDRLGILPRDAPLLIWEDPQRLVWEDEARQILAASRETQWLLKELPSGVHVRPEGGPESQNILFLWPYDLEPVDPIFPVPIPSSYPEIALRGLVTMLPEMKIYLERMPKPFVDGGYYTKTKENRLLCGSLPIEGAYVLGALSGYGLMAVCGAGELLAAHITGTTLPKYAPAFMLERYEDPAYLKMLQDHEPTGQL